MLEASDHPGELVVRTPSFLQCMKIGAGFALGAGLVSIFGFVFYLFFVIGLLGGIANALTSSRTAARASAPPAVSRSAPAPSSEFEQRVQRIQRERADLNEQTKAVDEARRREKTSRSSPGQ